MDDTNTQNKEPAAAPKLDPPVPVIAAIGVLRGNPIAFGGRRRVIVREV